MKAVLAAVVVLVGFLIYVVPLTEKGRSAAEPVVEEYYRRYNSRDFQFIFDRLLSAKAKTGTSPDLLNAAYGKLGAHKGKIRQSFKLLDLRGRRFYYRCVSLEQRPGAVDSRARQRALTRRVRRRTASVSGEQRSRLTSQRLRSFTRRTSSSSAASRTPVFGSSVASTTSVSNPQRTR